MNTDGAKLLFEYHGWSTQRILTTCAQISHDQYIAETPFGCLRRILVHLLDAELVWGAIYRGQSTLDWQEITEVDYPTFEALKDRLIAGQQAMRAYVGTLSDSMLSGPLRYPISDTITRERVLWHCLLHLVNHGTQHRSEAAALLTSYGFSPGDLDFTMFLNQYFNLPS